MDILLTICAVQSSVLLSAFVACQIYFSRKGAGLTKKELSQLGLAGIVLFSVLAYICFFDPQSVVFECSKETKTCVYRYSTIADKTLRERKLYDFSAATGTQVQKRCRRKRSGYKEYYYKAVVSAGKGSFDIPNEFTFRAEAEREAGRFSDFLRSDKETFLYENLKKEEEDTELLVLMSFLFTDALIFGGILVLIAKRSGRKRENG